MASLSTQAGSSRTALNTPWVLPLPVAGECIRGNQGTKSAYGDYRPHPRPLPPPGEAFAARKENGRTLSIPLDRQDKSSGRSKRNNNIGFPQQLWTEVTFHETCS